MGRLVLCACFLKGTLRPSMSSGAIHQGLPARRQIKALKEAEKWNQCRMHSKGGPDVFLLLMVKKSIQENFRNRNHRLATCILLEVAQLCYSLTMSIKCLSWRFSKCHSLAPHYQTSPSRASPKSFFTPV